ncbi:BatD family protein [Rhizobium sp. S163]|uniref:BatD family protein n=1 Tax=Rhizobium sp. S163 TaxID=3055039 RepID=UPI0025A9DE40|nr:BatD family protein [Rhizobium sp. S163]MDM9646785.1 BatD family protein [Rhizobium sp. S163]
MRTVLTCLFALFALRASAEEPFVRSAIEADDTIVAGEQIRLTVDVFAPGFFTSPPDFPLFEVPDALVTLPEERAQNLSQTVAGVQYSGIRKQYAIVPEKSGAFNVPPISINFNYSIDGKPTKATVATQAVSFEVAPPTSSSVLFAAHDVEITQSFDGDPAKLKVGDALVRTIVVTAKETQAMLLPPVDVGDAMGLRQYSQPPKLEDVSAGRGDIQSRRTETISYTAEVEGTFALPAIHYAWFDLDKSGQAFADLPSIKVSVAPALSHSAIAPEPERPERSAFEYRREVMMWILIALLVIGSLWSARGLPGAIRRRLELARAAIEQSEKYRLRQLRRTILEADPLQVYAALQRWAAADGFRTLADRVAGLPDLEKEILKLERLLFSGRSDDFDRRSVADALVRTSSQSSQTVATLPPLNPSG